MTLRTHCTPRQILAHRILDNVKAGLDVPADQVAAALIALGEPAE